MSNVTGTDFQKWFGEHIPMNEGGSPPLIRKISTHDYVGNMCAGFGGTAECRHVNYDTGEKCGRPPHDHGYRGRHVKETDEQR